MQIGKGKKVGESGNDIQLALSEKVVLMIIFFGIRLWKSSSKIYLWFFRKC